MKNIILTYMRSFLFFKKHVVIEDSLSIYFSINPYLKVYPNRLCIK